MDKFRILITEDSITQAMQLQHILEVNGYDATVAANGLEALRSMDEIKPSIFISDDIMPVMNGYELCQQIKSRESSRAVSVILLTALTQPQTVIRALQCGADRFITKPYEKQHLLSAIEHLKLNENLKSVRKIQTGIPVFYQGASYLITSSRIQILNLLLSAYEAAVAKNLELMETQAELHMLNRGLEEKVQARTNSLQSEVAERKSAETALQAKNEELNTVSQQLWQSAKLATMGELASSIAHELNNPLATVSLRIESLTAQTSDDDPRRRELDIIGREIERMGNLVNNLLLFSRRNMKQISTVDICEEIERTLELIDYHLRKNNIHIIRELGSAIPSILADRQQLRQLFLNLFTNANDAMPKGGTLTIRVAAQPEENKIIIEIADTGSGIPPENLPKVMEPFYTTKPEGKGTGLGLAICRRIAQEHRGTMDILSEGVPGQGTKVRLTLSSKQESNSTCFINQ